MKKIYNIIETKDNRNGLKKTGLKLEKGYLKKMSPDKMGYLQLPFLHVFENQNQSKTNDARFVWCQ